MPRGVDFKIPLADALQAHTEHMAGWSLRAIARMRWEAWGYSSPHSALEGLRGVFRALELPVRDRVTATVEASTVHGNSRRAFAKADHPEHARHLAQRRHCRALARVSDDQDASDA